ncbi:protein kinase subdomain-containing protein [Beauveria bassiana ARSEF 2860]|uniref:Protein kinase subdomain-containing protein n=1 Tax=Beauveria bassiana (strain ARSEF 2860) TaxID=655819 RepID=J5JZH9_BEAB2|nr:protein kinase subdomain-containing protein [Beauveria bassiana ARSEF 2860]EJP67526.1 protein kinase subdomain-containing protein [Beauveria bassiana ARSEF 2860]
MKSGSSPVCKVRALGKVEIMMSRTPQMGLESYVTHAETGIIIGFLREWVESSHLGATLDSIYMGNIDLDTRQKWADQIEEAMTDLHDIGLFWGDCKPVNVIVDEKQNL